MATTNVILRRTEKAAVDLRTKQFTFVKYDGSGNLVPAAEGDRAWILEDTPNVGEHGTTSILGITKGKVGAAISAGQDLTSDAAGLVIPADAGDAVNGIALEAASTGDLAEFQTATGNK
jgi:hypothetical protein